MSTLFAPSRWHAMQLTMTATTQHCLAESSLVGGCSCFKRSAPSAAGPANQQQSHPLTWHAAHCAWDMLLQGLRHSTAVHAAGMSPFTSQGQHQGTANSITQPSSGQRVQLLLPLPCRSATQRQPACRAGSPPPRTAAVPAAAACPARKAPAVHTQLQQSVHEAANSASAGALHRCLQPVAQGADREWALPQAQPLGALHAHEGVG